MIDLVPTDQPDQGEPGSTPLLRMQPSDDPILAIDDDQLNGIPSPSESVVHARGTKFAPSLPPVNAPIERIMLPPSSIPPAGSLEDGYDIRPVQELLGHRDATTTMIDLHVLNRGALGVRSPVDRL